MSITDELREWVRDGKGSLLAIADRIDAEHESAVMSAMNDALYHANEKDMAELGWIRLPKDADGVPIHIGDVVTARLMFGGTSKPLVVDRMELSRGKDGYLWTIALDTDKSCFNLPDILRHYHAPTVEDVLTEFTERVCDGLHTPKAVDTQVIIAEYAAKLRLAGDAE